MTRLDTEPPTTTDDPMHHPPKSARVGLGPDNEPAGAEAHGGYYERIPPEAPDQRGVTDLFKELRDEITHLLRQELNLAKTEASEKARFFGKQAGMIGAGGAVLAVGGLMILAAIAYFIGAIFQAAFETMAAGAAYGIGFAIVGVIVAIIGYALYASARAKMKREPVTPERTLQSLKDDQQWLTHKTQEVTQEATR